MLKTQSEVCMVEKIKIKLFAIVDKYGRIYWTAGEQEHIPDHLMQDKGLSLVILRGEADAKN